MFLTFFRSVKAMTSYN